MPLAVYITMMAIGMSFNITTSLLINISSKIGLTRYAVAAELADTRIMPIMAKAYCLAYCLAYLKNLFDTAFVPTVCNYYLVC